MTRKFILLWAVSACSFAQIPLWPDKEVGNEHDTTKATDQLIAGRRVIRLGNVTRPDMTIYRPAKNTSRAAVLVFPGGGYNILALDLEGTEVCEWLQSIGVTGVLVKYRVPGREGAFEDAKRALTMVRARVAELDLDPQKIGVLGFSAGAHLAARVSNNASERPNFALLIYPAYLTEGNLNVTANTPPTFLVQTEDDGVKVENSLVYYAALKQAKVSVEMHLYPTGGHGYGLRPTEKLVTTWPARAEEWLRSMGFAK